MEDWPHAPPHRLLLPGTYMITSATYNKVHYFNSFDRLKFLHDTLLKLANEYQWQLCAWAIFSNHYHFIAQSPEKVSNLKPLLSQLHVTAAKYVNAQDVSPQRKVWHQFWDSHLTYQYSYLARLNYVNQNPVKHGLVTNATDYPWCSASWFEKTNTTAFLKTISNFKIDKVKVIDDF